VVSHTKRKRKRRRRRRRRRKKDVKLDIPLQEAIGLCFIVHRSPFGDDIKNPMESEIQLA